MRARGTLAQESRDECILPFKRPEPLCPDDLRIAADAFEAALQSFPEQARELRPYTARHLLARYIIERALGGERDPTRLKEGALSYLSIEALRHRPEVPLTKPTSLAGSSHER